MRIFHSLFKNIILLAVALSTYGGGTAWGESAREYYTKLRVGYDFAPKPKATEERVDDRIFEVRMRDGFSAGAVIGAPIYQENDYITEISLELEAAYRGYRSKTVTLTPGSSFSGPVNGLDADFYTLMANSVFQFARDPLDPVRLYLLGGIGVGYGVLDLNARIQTEQTDNFASVWQIGFGLDYLVSEQLTASLGYRYTSLGKYQTKIVNSNQSHKIDYGTANSIVTELKYRF